MKIYGFILTNANTGKTFLFLKVKAVIIYIRDEGNRLRIVYMDGFIRCKALIKFVIDQNRAVLRTGRTTRAFVLYDVPGLLDQADLEVSRFPFYTIDFSIAQDLYVWMPADLDQFGRENSHRAVIGGKGLVKLGHMATNGW